MLNFGCDLCLKDIKAETEIKKYAAKIAELGLDRYHGDIRDLPQQEKELLRRYYLLKEYKEQLRVTRSYCVASEYVSPDELTPWVSAHQEFWAINADSICSCCNWEISYENTIQGDRPGHLPCFSCPYAWQGIPLKASVIRTMDECSMDEGIHSGMLPPGVENIFDDVPDDKPII